jgi:hypothetical protein
MPGRLHFRDSVGREGTVELGSSEIVFVGRGLDCAIRTDDGMVSRKHSQIRREGERYVVEDLGSSNGTLLNDVRVQKQVLGNNDIIKCGSLTIRFIEDRAPERWAGPAPMQLPPTDLPVRSPPISRSLDDDISRGPASQRRQDDLPYGGPPEMPSGGQPLPYGGPPAMPAAEQARAAARPTGPAPVGSSPSMFGQGAPASIPRKRDTSVKDAENKVMVDLGIAIDPAKLQGDIVNLRADLEKAMANYEREVADSKRLRAESSSLRSQIDESRLAIKDREDRVAANDRVNEDLREELQTMRNDLVQMRVDLAQTVDALAVKDRALVRAQDDASKNRDDVEDLNRQLLEVIRNKDEGWKKLNLQLTEIEQLREVINAQERMLEERRIGLISQEEVIKELRAERERSVKTIAQLKAERDEAAGAASRAAAQISAVEEENKRLGRLMVEAQTDAGRGGGGGNPEQTLRLNNELKDVRVELRRVESDRDRLTEQVDREEQARLRMESKLATIEVELQETLHLRMTAESARNVAQDALAKAEVARHRAAEEVLLLQRAKDTVSTGSDDAKRESDRLRRRVAELEARTAASVAEPLDIKASRDAQELKTKQAVERAAALEKQLRGLQSEIEIAKADTHRARLDAEKAASALKAAKSATSLVSTTTTTTSNGHAELQRKAREVYDNINDILSEIRNNVVLVQSEIGTATPTVRDAVDALVDNAETAKGALRGLRDLAENK